MHQYPDGCNGSPRKLTPEELKEKREVMLLQSSINHSVKKGKIKRLFIYFILVLAGYLFSTIIGESDGRIPAEKEKEMIFITFLYLGLGFAQGYIISLLLRFIRSKEKITDIHLVVVIPPTIVITLYQLFSPFMVTKYYHDIFNIMLVGLCIYMLQWVLIVMMVVSDEDLVSLMSKK